MSRVIVWQATGMTCRSCEKLIGNELRNIPGVEDVEVSLKKSKAAIRLADDANEPNLTDVNLALGVHGYRLHELGCEIPSLHEPLGDRVWKGASAMLLLLIVLWLLQPIRDRLPSTATGASVGAMFFLGLIASVSSCLASTGGYLLAYTAKARSKMALVSVHAGRVATFIVGGALLGWLGGSLPTGSTSFYAIFGLVLAVGFFGVGLQLMDLAPSWQKLGLRLPAWFDGAEKISQSKKPWTSLLVGASTFVLPCGFTQTAQALALGSGSALTGALILGAFSIGTLPVLAGLTSFGSADVLKKPSVKRFVGAMLLVFAFTHVQSSLSLLGYSTVDSGPRAQATEASGEQVVKMVVTGSGYTPSVITIKQNVPVRWEIDATNASGCTSSIVSRALGIGQALERGMNVITFTPTQEGTIAFSCGMGMVRGSFQVVKS